MFTEFTRKNIPLPVNLKTKKAFVKWADGRGWQPYDGLDTWINLKQGRRLAAVDTLFEDYKKEVLQNHEKVL